MNAGTRSKVTHRGKTIIVHDYTNLAGDIFLNAIESNTALSLKDPGAERLLLLDFTNAVIDKSAVKAFKKMAVNAPTRVSKGAIIGVSGIQHFFVSTVSKFAQIPIEVFDTRDAALKWLVSP